MTPLTAETAWNSLVFSSVVGWVNYSVQEVDWGMCFIQMVSGLSIIRNDCGPWKVLNYLHICIFIITTSSITAEENQEQTCDKQKRGEKRGKALITSDVKSASELQSSRRFCSVWLLVANRLWQASSERSKASKRSLAQRRGLDFSTQSS